MIDRNMKTPGQPLTTNCLPGGILRFGSKAFFLITNGKLCAEWEHVFVRFVVASID